MNLARGLMLLVMWGTCVAASRSCSENCKTSTIPTCNIDTGACFQGCIPGYYGNTCNMTCDAICKQNICQLQDGSCFCKPGYTFNSGSCNPTTGVKCKSNDNCMNNKCISAGRSNCLHGCKPGWFGELCQQSCSSHCVCDKEYGICTSCISEWYGEECESPCSPGCVDKKCDKEYGNCTSCIPGWYGAECGSPCSPGCVDKQCDRISGICTSCIPGWYGEECGSPCSPGCVDKDCHRNGTCVGGCGKKYIGEKCQSSCPVECYDDRCRKNGSCNTCRPGFYGTFCNQTCHQCIGHFCEMITGDCLSGCQRGFYGEGCTKSCGKCTDEACNQTTGECTIGCQSGHYGSFCGQTCENCLGGECDKDTGECSDEWSSVQSWVGGGVAVGILIIIAVGVYMSCRLKRIQGVVYNIEKRRRFSVEQDDQPVGAQAYFELEEQVTVAPRGVRPGVPIRQTSYIEPRHSGNFGNLQARPQLQAARASDQQEDEPQGTAAPTSDRLQQKVQRRADEWSQRSDSYVLPHYCEVDEEGMATLPQPAQGAQASTSVLKKTVSSRAVDVHATRGDIRIPPIAECFGPTGTEDSSPDLQPLVENYDHLTRVGIPRIDGPGASRSCQVDDEVRLSLERLCQMNTARSDSYIEPRQSDCTVSPQHQTFSSEASDQQDKAP